MKSSATTVSAQGTTLGTVAAGTTLQQEFFNYVVASSAGFGQFVQNIIGGGQYTGAYSNSYDLTGFETVSSMYFGTNDSDIDYYTSSANGGDKDTDWFMHSMYLGSSQFQTVSTSTASANAIVTQDNIKANVKTITVSAPYTDEALAIFLYNADGKMLVSATGDGSVTLDLAGIETKSKDNCYLVISHSRTVSAVNQVPYYGYMDWDTDFPAAPVVSATTTISKVTITY